MSISSQVQMAPKNDSRKKTPKKQPCSSTRHLRYKATDEESSGFIKKYPIMVEVEKRSSLPHCTKASYMGQLSALTRPQIKYLSSSSPYYPHKS